MTEILIKFVVPFLFVGGACLIHRWDARRIERKRNAPYRTFALPIFAALNDPDVDHVEITIKRSEDGHNWDGHREIHYKTETRP